MPGKQHKRIDPMTGKRVPMPGVDTINPKKLPYEVMVSETARLAQEMADLRKKWAGLKTTDRYNRKGRALASQYRHAAYKFKELTGQEPVPIYADQY